MDDLQKIDEEIKRLNIRRSDLLTYDRNKIITSLEWTKKCSAKLYISAFSSVGLPKYEILVFGTKDLIPYCSGQICVMGDSKEYQYNMMFSSSNFSKDCPYFFTSSDDMLFKFLETVTFQKFEYDTKALEILLRIQAISEKYND
jgi:hypothetical protein